MKEDPLQAAMQAICNSARYFVLVESQRTANTSTPVCLSRLLNPKLHGDEESEHKLTKANKSIVC